MADSQYLPPRNGGIAVSPRPSLEVRDTQFNHQVEDLGKIGQYRLSCSHNSYWRTK